METTCSAVDRSGTTLVINLTRFGDLLQCQPLIEDLHCQGQTVHLVCLDNFSSAQPLLRHVERTWPLPGARLMADMDKDWRIATALLLEFARAVRSEARPGCVVNLTTTLPARLLTGLLAGGQADGQAEIRGFCLDAHGFGQNRGIWSTFLNSGATNRLSAPFNIADMFRMVGAPHTPAAAAVQARQGLADPPQEAQDAVNALLAGVPPETCGFVAMQLGASEARRQWPAHFFAEVGDQLWRERKLCPVLLGSPAERPLAEAYAQAAQSHCVDAVGKTNLTQLAALLRRSKLLFTNDTGTMHLAAGLGVPCLAIFLATAQPCDTGPYLPGCCCLEPALPCHPCPFGRPCPNNLACVTHISPRSVGSLALSWLDAGRWDAAPLDLVEREARVWLTEQDDKGFMTVRCLTEHTAEDRSLWLAQQRIFWRQILDELDDAARPAAVEQQSADTRLSEENAPSASAHGTAHVDGPAAAFSAGFAQRMAASLEQAAQLFEMLTQQGQLLGKSPKAGQLFLRNCERLQTVFDACPELRSLGAFWRELRQERGDRLDDLLELTAQLGAHFIIWRHKFTDGTSFA